MPKIMIYNFDEERFEESECTTLVELFSPNPWWKKTPWWKKVINFLEELIFGKEK